VDQAAIRAAMNSKAGSAAYNIFLDYDQNGVLDRTDYTAFPARFGKTLA